MLVQRRRRLVGLQQAKIGSTFYAYWVVFMIVMEKTQAVMNC